MNLKEIKEIIALMQEHNLTEIEIERDGLKLKLRKGSIEFNSVASNETVVQNLPPLPNPKTNHVVAPPAAEATKSNHLEIKSPMVGTFYRSPSPDAAPFIELGQTVEVGQVVCIVEAMKLMNEIKSEVRGKVVQAAVENAEPVEFGQLLFAVEPL